MATRAQSAERKSGLERAYEAVRRSRVPARVRRRGGDVVLLAAEDWDAIQETLHIASIPGAVARVRDGRDYKELKTINRPALERLLKA